MAAGAAAGTRAAAVAEFVTWARQNGAYISPALEFLESASGVTCFAQADISSDTPVIRVPKDLVITVDTACSEIPALAPLVASGEVSHASALALLLALKGRDVQWRFYKYACCLPAQVDTPLHWDSGDVQLLKGTGLFSVVQQRVQAIDTDYETISRNGQAAHVGYHEFLLAHSLVSSRCFPGKLLAEDRLADSPILLPIVDLLDHRPRTPVTWTTASHRNPEISISYHEALQAGSEVCNNYGPKSNAERRFDDFRVD